MVSRTPEQEVFDDPVEPPDEAVDTSDMHWTEKIALPTPPSEIHQRGVWKNGQPVVNQDGSPVLLDYITARFVMDRLDEAVGAARWQTTFETLPSGAVRCGIGIFNPDDTFTGWVYKYDVGTPSTIEGEKGAHSDALKRAAVQWGIARDLYEERDGPGAGDQAQVRMDQPIMPRGANGGMQQPMQQPVLGQPTLQQQMQGQAQPMAQQPQQYAEDGQVKWLCPIHNSFRVQPAGVSKKSGRPYQAFYVCDVAGCDQTGPRA
jgi:hypothetical protein